VLFSPCDACREDALKWNTSCTDHFSPHCWLCASTIPRVASNRRIIVSTLYCDVQYCTYWNCLYQWYFKEIKYNLDSLHNYMNRIYRQWFRNPRNSSITSHVDDAVFELL
jgi:hypothetical protein